MKIANAKVIDGLRPVENGKFAASGGLLRFP
jgi:hypothetical protein